MGVMASLDVRRNSVGTSARALAIAGTYTVARERARAVWPWARLITTLLVGQSLTCKKKPLKPASQRAHTPAAQPNPKSAPAEVERIMHRERSVARHEREKTDGAPNQNNPNTLKPKARGVSGWPRWATLTRRQAEPVEDKSVFIAARR